jgi:hypothetical protein
MFHCVHYLSAAPRNSAGSSVSRDIKCSKQMGRLSVCLSVCQHDRCDRQAVMLQSVSIRQQLHQQRTRQSPKSSNAALCDCKKAFITLKMSYALHVIWLVCTGTCGLPSAHFPPPPHNYIYAPKAIFMKFTVTIICGYPMYRILSKSENVVNTGKILLAPFSTTVKQHNSIKT